MRVFCRSAAAAVAAIAAAAVVVRSVNAQSSSSGADTATAYLEDAIRRLRGDDDRLVPWDVTEYTAQQQEILCPTALPYAITVLCFPRGNRSEHKPLAAALVAWCLTDHPANRATFATHHPDIYASVVQLLSLPTNDAAAARLIWIAVFGSAANHAGFVKAGAVPALSKIVLLADDTDTDSESSSSPVTVMWAAAALQNLAASYCDNDEEDPRCYWEWHDDTTDHHHETLQLTPDSGRMIVDGSAVRVEMLSIPGLVDRLIEWSCRGPVQGIMSEDNPFCGENAVIATTTTTTTTTAATTTSDEQQQKQQQHEPSHENSPNIVPWAATGALKNLALEPAFKALLEPVMACFCWLTQSPDWLEAEKGQAVLHHLRRWNPCWFEQDVDVDKDPEEEGDSNEAATAAAKTLCIDHVFTDENGDNCEDYSTSTKEECATSPDRQSGVLASVACCSCGGGDEVGMSNRKGHRHEANDAGADEL